MDDVTPSPIGFERLGPEEIGKRARAAVAEGRTISHERMLEWLVALERDDGDHLSPPETDAELDLRARTKPTGR